MLQRNIVSECNKSAVSIGNCYKATRAKDLIFIDESGVNLVLTRLFARSPKGQRVYGTSPQSSRENVSVISASLFGVVTQISLIGATDGLTFETFISQKLVPKLWAGACVVMDNCQGSPRRGNSGIS